MAQLERRPGEEEGENIRSLAGKGSKLQTGSRVYEEKNPGGEGGGGVEWGWGKKQCLSYWDPGESSLGRKGCQKHGDISTETIQKS